MPFSGKSNSNKAVREVQRKTRAAQRDLNRDQQELQREEARLEAEIKKSAAKNDRQTCSILAKQLVAVRNQRRRTMGCSAQVSALNSQQRIAASTVTMGKIMGSTTGIMKQMNKQVDPQKLSKTMKDYEKAQSEISMKEDLMDDMMDDVDTGEADEVVQQVLDEIGIDLTGQLNKVPVPNSSVSASGIPDMASLRKELGES